MRIIVRFLILITLWHILFWQQLPGINLAIFTTLILVAHFIEKGGQKLSKFDIFLMICFTISAYSQISIGSAVSTLVLVLSFVALYGKLRLAGSSVLENTLNQLFNFINLKENLLPGVQLLPEPVRRQRGLLYVRLAFVPLILFTLFAVLFSAGNAIFNNWSGTVFGDFFRLLESVSLSYFFFLTFGILLLRWLFLKKPGTFLSLKASNFLSRKDKKPSKLIKKLGLRDEYVSALMIFASLNVLFLVVNFIDIKWVWFQFDPPTGFSLKEFVHEGVGWLILTLLLSMTVIFYFFRFNLNFYPKRKTLRRLAQIWVFQNGILAISVALRTWYYVESHALAGRRLGVFVFLALVFIGLVSLSLKIWKRHNSAWVIRINSAFALALFTLCATVNWDKFIVRYNLENGIPSQVDVDFYLDANPQVYPIVFENLDKVEE